MSDTRKQIGNAATYMIPLVIGNLIPIITLPIFTRLLTREDYGAIALANAWAVVVVGVAGLGLPNAYDRNFFEYATSEQRGHLLHSVVAFSALTFCLFALLTWIVRARVTGWLIGDDRYQELLVWSTAASAVVTIKGYYMTFLRNSEQAAEYAAYMVAERLLAAILTLILVGPAHLGAVGMVLGQMAASAAVLLVIVYRFSPRVPRGFDRALLTDSLVLGVPMVPRVFFGVVGNNLDKYLIGQVASLGGVGIYSIGQRVAAIAFTYMTALQNVFGPRVYSKMFSEGADGGRAIGRYLTPFAYASTFMAFLIAVFSEEILSLLTPPPFHAAVPVVSILVLSQAILFFGKMPQISFARKTYLVSVIAAVSTALTAGLGALGIMLWGTVGAAWGALAAGLSSTAVAFVIGQRCFRIEWEVRRMVAIFGLLFLCALLAIALRDLGVPYALRLVTKVAGLAAFLWIGVRLRYLSAENFAIVREMVRDRIRPRQAGA